MLTFILLIWFQKDPKLQSCDKRFWISSLFLFYLCKRHVKLHEMPTYAEHFLFPNVWFLKLKKIELLFFLSLQGLKSYKVYETILAVRFPLKRDKKKRVYYCIDLFGFYHSRIICFQFTELFISINNFKRVNSSVLCLMRFISTIYFDNLKSDYNLLLIQQS